MRYIINESNHVTAVTFGAGIVYNDYACVEYTGSVPPGWETLDDWYFDEGDKLWRWQIVDGDLTLDENAVAPKEYNWNNIVITDPVFATTAYSNAGNSIKFDLPNGTKYLRCFFILPTKIVNFEKEDERYCVAVRVSVDENIIDVICGSRNWRIEISNTTASFELGENSVEVSTPTDYIDGQYIEGVLFPKNTQYVLYPFYHR